MEIVAFVIYIYIYVPGVYTSVAGFAVGGQCAADTGTQNRDEFVSQAEIFISFSTKFIIFSFKIHHFDCKITCNRRLRLRVKIDPK